MHNTTEYLVTHHNCSIAM